MKIVTFLGLMNLALFVASCSNGQSQSKLSPTAFAQKIASLPEAPIIDVRTPEEYLNGHFPNALNMDWNGSDFDKQISSLDKGKPVFVYCLSGGRSTSAAYKMREVGFKEVYELDGGIMKWRRDNLPETTQKTIKSTGMNRQQFEDFLKTDKVVLIDFYADWCAPCKKMKPYLDEISKEMGEKVTVIRINADENPALCKELKVEALPVLQIYKKGHQTWTFEGYIEKALVVKELD